MRVTNRPTVRAARGGLAGRRVQAVVTGVVVLVSTAACTLALGLLVDSNAPFDRAFAAPRGAQVMATVTPPDRLATATPAGMTAKARPFGETTANLTIAMSRGPGQPAGVLQTQLTVVGRGSPGAGPDPGHRTERACRQPRRPGRAQPGRAGARGAGRAAGPARHAALRGRSRR
jgi:putative ABC transport system permease protein